jgi:hypothetical protein
MQGSMVLSTSHTVNMEMSFVYKHGMSTLPQCMWDKLLIFVALGGIPTRGQASRHVRIFFGTIFYFCFNEIGLEMRLGLHGKVDGVSGFVWGCHTHKED